MLATSLTTASLIAVSGYVAAMGTCSTRWFRSVELKNRITRSRKLLGRTNGGHHDQTFRSNLHLNCFPYEFRGCYCGQRQCSKSIRRPVAVGGYADNRGLQTSLCSRGVQLWRSFRTPDEAL